MQYLCRRLIGTVLYSYNISVIADVLYIFIIANTTINSSGEQRKLCSQRSLRVCFAKLYMHNCKCYNISMYHINIILHDVIHPQMPHISTICSYNISQHSNMIHQQSQMLQYIRSHRCYNIFIQYIHIIHITYQYNSLMQYINMFAIHSCNISFWGNTRERSSCGFPQFCPAKPNIHLIYPYNSYNSFM